jgi:septin family protein
MLDLINTTEETHYENYRQQQMETRKFGEPKVKKLDNPKFKEEEETLRKRFTEQVKLEESRFRSWEQHVRPIFLGNQTSCWIDTVKNHWIGLIIFALMPLMM